jgi:hypothetical protein
MGMFLKNMLWYDHAIFSSKVFGFGDVVGSEIGEHQHTGGEKGKEYASLFDVGNSDRVETKADSFSSTLETSENTLSRTLEPAMEGFTIHLQNSSRPCEES